MRTRALKYFFECSVCGEKRTQSVTMAFPMSPSKAVVLSGCYDLGVKEGYVGDGAR